MMKETAEGDQEMRKFEDSEDENSKDILDEWDSDDGICSSRDPAKNCKSLAKVFLFLICFLGLLTLFSIGVMVLFHNIFNKKEEPTPPKIRVPVPKLLFEPNIGKKNFIRCTNDKPETKSYLKKMTSFVKHINPKSYDSQDCPDLMTSSPERPCRFNMSQLGNVCVKKRSFGFEDCRICVALTLERVTQWKPIPYTNESVPAEIRDRFSKYAVSVSCKGLTAVDAENLGPIAYYPPEGFHIKYFPYAEQKGYNTPIVMIHFKKPSKFVVIRVECKAWADNIDHKKNEGTANFALYLE